MGENEVINVLKLANNNELRDLQEKVEYFRNQIRNLELEKTKCTNDVLILTRRIDELRETVDVYESSLNEKREEMADMNKEFRRLYKSVNDNNENSGRDSGKYSQSNARWCGVGISSSPNGDFTLYDHYARGENRS